LHLSPALLHVRGEDGDSMVVGDVFYLMWLQRFWAMRWCAVDSDMNGLVAVGEVAVV